MNTPNWHGAQLKSAEPVALNLTSGSLKSIYIYENFITAAYSPCLLTYSLTHSFARSMVQDII
jgi:hypothetical protein